MFTGVATKIHLVFENQNLLNRDKADFELFFEMFEFSIGDVVQYHVGIDFEVGENELVLVDEADCFIFE